MPRLARASFPEDFANVRQHFDAWRAAGTRHRKIPDQLWDQAVSLARKHGLNLTKTALGLDYYSLKRRVEAATQRVSLRSKRSDKVTARRKHVREQHVPDTRHSPFLELPLPLPSPVSASDCMIEFTRVSGATLRVQWKGNHPPDLVALGKQFWSGR